jgi:predicted Zn-dependent protease
LPADADPLRYLSAVADFEAVAGADAAAPAWAAAQQRWPGEPRVYLALGNQAHAAGDLAAAAGLYRQGLAHAPGEPVLSNNYASVMAGLGCPAQALAALDTVAAAAGSPWQAQLAQTRREVQALPSAGRAPAAQCVPLALSLP